MKTRNIYPSWVEKHRGPGKEIKKIGGRYYLTTYEYKTVDGKRKKVSTGTLGTIKEDGLVSSCKRGSSIRKNLGFPLEYGASFLLESLGKDVFKNLCEYFNGRLAGQIFEMGKIGLISPSPFKRMDLIHSNSYGSVLRPDLPLSPASITSILKEIGCNRQAQLMFMRKYYSQAEYIIFDGTKLVSHSLGERGYNHCGIDDPQMNLQYCFSISPSKAPVYFRALKGDRTDISTLRASIRESGIENAIFIADKGYYSTKNAKALANASISYLMPIRRDDSRIEYGSFDISSMKGMDGYFSFRGRPIFYKFIRKPKEGEEYNETIILYFDEKMRGREVVDSTSKGRSMDDISKSFPKMGTITLSSNIKDLDDAQKIYETYKEREIIEEANDAYKNVMNKNASSLQDMTSYYGWLFINHITLILYYRVFNCIKEKGMTSRLSVADTIEMLKRITLQKVAGQDIVEIGAKIDYRLLSAIFGDSIPKE